MCQLSHQPLESHISQYLYLLPFQRSLALSYFRKHLRVCTSCGKVSKSELNFIVQKLTDSFFSTCDSAAGNATQQSSLIHVRPLTCLCWRERRCPLEVRGLTRRRYPVTSPVAWLHVSLRELWPNSLTCRSLGPTTCSSTGNGIRHRKKDEMRKHKRVKERQGWIHLSVKAQK